MAPTLFQIEESYKDQVNFVMVNGDDPNNWPLIEALGVDAIPHLAMVEADGTVDTALIGAVPKEWISRDIDVLLDNASKEEQTPKRELPYRMLDVFVNRPENRKFESGKWWESTAKIFVGLFWFAQKRGTIEYQKDTSEKSRSL